MRTMAWVQGVALVLVVSLVVMFNLGVAGVERAMMLAWLSHGVLFLVYIAMLGWAMGRKVLSTRESWIGFIAAMIPLGSLIYERKVLRQHPYLK